MRSARRQARARSRRTVALIAPAEPLITDASARPSEMPDPYSGTPVVRASDAEREVVVARLRIAAGEGRLTLDELANRLDRALAAVTRADLEPLIADLPAESPSAPSAAKARRWIVGIMGGGDHRGRWRIASRCNVVNLMGGADLDLSCAIVAGAETEIRVFSLMGGSDITVPEGVQVELTGFAFMGGNDLHLEQAPAPLPGAPVVRVRAYSVMGGTDVKLSAAGARQVGDSGPRPPLPPRV